MRISHTRLSDFNSSLSGEERFERIAVLGGGTPDSTVLRGICDSERNRIAGTQTNDGEERDDGDNGDDARQTVT